MSSATSRPRCSVFIATSLDGFIAKRDGSTDWLRVVERPGEDYGFAAFSASTDVLVMGRKTYETVLTFPEWPYGDTRLVVVTHNAPAARRSEEFFSGTPRELVESLGASGAKHLYIDGGVLIRQFLEAGLLDSLTISIIPVLLGEGIPLFGGGGLHALKLESSQSFESGLVQLRYVPG